jgi:oligoribonuclease
MAHVNRFTALMDLAEDERPASDEGAAENATCASAPNTEAAENAASAAAPAAEAATSPLVDPIFWVDLEMTGLDPATHTILEVAVIASDGALKTLVEGPSLAIHQDDATLSAMNEWSQEQHGRSGLTERCRTSPTLMSEAEKRVVEFITQHAGGRLAVLGGACVYKDLEFIERHMPALRKCVSHRVVDVATLRELAYRWTPSVARRAPRGESSHRALDDIRYSSEECRYWRDKCWQPLEPPRRRAARKKPPRGGEFPRSAVACGFAAAARSADAEEQPDCPSDVL